MSYPVTLFIRPNGARRELKMTQINQEDEDYLRENNVKISAEDCGPFFTIWADDGKIMEDGDEPDEITYIVRNGETFQQAMHNICNELRERKQS